MPKVLKIWLALGLVAAVVGGYFVVEYLRNPTKAYIHDGPSMEPTIRHGQRISARLGVADSVTVGDVVVVRNPFDGQAIVKRVVAVGGQEVRVAADCRLAIDAEPLAREPVECPPGDYLEGDGPPRCFREGSGSQARIIMHGGMGCRVVERSVAVPAGHVFVMGDHRDRSNDSANPRIGPIAVSEIVGVVQLDD